MPEPKHRKWRVSIQRAYGTLRTIGVIVVNRYRRGAARMPETLVSLQSRPSRRRRKIALHNGQGSQANLREQREAHARWLLSNVGV